MLIGSLSWLLTACYLLPQILGSPYDIKSWGAVVRSEPDLLKTTQNRVKRETGGLKILNLHIASDIAYRYADTLVSSRVANPTSHPQLAEFTVVLPETAFISGFLIEVDGKVYKAHVKEKKEAEDIFHQAVDRGQTAAHVKQSARDSNKFTVSVNVEPQKKMTFNLTYEELLQRELDVYRQVININPGQVVDDMKVVVNIKEPRNITKIRVPEIQSGNEVYSEPLSGNLDTARIIRIAPDQVKVEYTPSKEEQSKPDALTKGLSGQFAVEYDIDRTPSGAEVLTSDGYLVHFFSPPELQPLKKHVVFVLDVSGSMSGQKIIQLKTAMRTILTDLRPDDYFSIIEFSSSVTIQNLNRPSVSRDHIFGAPPREEETLDLPEEHSFPATERNKEKAVDIINNMVASGGTNIAEALSTAVRVARSTPKSVVPASTKPSHEPGDHQPMILFLTDGEPTVRETNPVKIIKTYNELNRNPLVPTFCLAFGEGADLKFLKSLAMLNGASGRQIYEAADAALQLQGYYSRISSPLLSHVQFEYKNDSVEEPTKQKFHNYFNGSELVVAMKLKENLTEVTVVALSAEGMRRYVVDEIDFIPVPFKKVREDRPFGALEKLWAYLTVRQNVDKMEALNVAKNTLPSNLSEDTLKCALKYSFVCPLTSLVVVKPDSGEENVGLQSAKPMDETSLSFARPLSHFVQHTPLSTYRPPPPPPPSFAAGLPFYGVIDKIDQVLDTSAEESLPSTTTTTTTTEAPTTTTTTTTTTVAPTTIRTPDVLDDVNQVWLEDLRRPRNNLVVNETIYSLGLNQPDTGRKKCKVGGATAGTCKHLQYCLATLRTVSDSVSFIQDYFCVVHGNTAGICCPDSGESATLAVRMETEPTTESKEKATEQTTLFSETTVSVEEETTGITLEIETTTIQPETTTI